jgi:glycosyltransferase involved in cell wall biosynthesis
VRCLVFAERSSGERRSDAWARKLDRGWATAYIANSERGAGNLRARIGGGGAPVFVVRNGVEAFAPRLSRRLGAPPCLVCVANITPNKGQEVLLEAVGLLQVRYPGIRAVLVGDDFTDGAFARSVERRGLTASYVATGFVDDVGEHLAAATIFVLPSLRREGTPTALLEAMATGVPIVASAVGGVSEIVQNGATGLLVRPGDPVDLAAAVDELLSDEPFRHLLATNARREIVRHHSLTAMIEGHRSVFQGAMRRSGASEGSGAESEAGAAVAHVTTSALSLRYLLANQLRAIQAWGYGVVGISSPGREARWLETSGIPHLPVPMTRRVTPVADLVSLVRLYKVMRARRFAIVHAHNPKPGLLAQLAAVCAGVPIVVNTVHGYYFHDRMRPLARRFYVALERIAARCSDLILIQNEEDALTALRERIASPGQIRVLGNGIDVRRFDPARLATGASRRIRTLLGIPAEVPVVGFVGRLVEEKGVRDLLVAARGVLDRLPEARFLLVGEADAEKSDAVTPALAGRLGVAEACVFAGAREDMPAVYAAMDVFVLPSHREGFPRAPLEASAMRVPSVVTDIRGCRQAVTHGRNGLLVPVGDTEALGNAIVRVLTDRDLAGRLGEEGRRRALAEFDEERIFETVRREYERLLYGKGLGHRVPALRAAVVGSSGAGR